jgi:hypothetical protein
LSQPYPDGQLTPEEVWQSQYFIGDTLREAFWLWSDDLILSIGGGIALDNRRSFEALYRIFDRADGRYLRRWLPIDGEIALRHAVPEAVIETKLVGSPLLDWMGRPNTIDSLQDELRRLGVPTVLLLHVVLAAALERQRVHVTVAIDELLSAIGWRPRSTTERETMRRDIWRWLAILDAMHVIGQRKGRYRDPDTRDVLDLTSVDALIRITGQRMPAQLAFDSSQPPIEVTYVAGPWLDKWRGNRQVLSYFGDVRKLAAIPGGKPSGAWAQAIGLALNQLWRERAARAQVARVGEDNHRTVRVGTFTRRQLLTMFPPSPSVEEVLGSPNPRRAQGYWNDAISLLKTVGVVAHYQETTPLHAGRQGWAEPWLTQSLDIRPADEEKQAVMEIANRAATAHKTRAKRRGKTGAA